MVPVVYGFPVGELIRRAQQGKVILGGCAVGTRRWGCLECRTDDDDEPSP